MIEPDFEKQGGLVPAIIQDYKSGSVLMLGFMNREAWLATLQTGRATFWSRSRKKLWGKGETSGNIQIVKGVYVDCDDDAVLLKVDQVGGAACHTGYQSCFYREIKDGEVKIAGERIFNPEEVYK